MNTFKYEEINIGDTVSFDFDITNEKMESFKNLTGDLNPLHNDLEYAKKLQHPEKVVYGMLTASVLSTLAGMYLPGKYSLIHEVEISFVKPVYISNSPLKVNAEVIEKEDRFKQIKIKYKVIDKNETKVLRGTMKIGVSE